VEKRSKKASVVDALTKDTALKKPWKALGDYPWKVASAPGRLDLLNTHQDYKRLPVVSSAINLRTYVFGRKLTRRVIKVKSLDLVEEGKEFQDEFELKREVPLLEEGWFGNYIRGVVRALLRRVEPSALSGLEVVVDSQVPIGSGLSSSAALEVAFVKLMDHVNQLELTDHEIAETAFEAENRELSIPCGRLDQYTSTFGGTILLSTKPPYDIFRLRHTGLRFAVLDSGVQHHTQEIHSERQRELNHALSKLMEAAPPAVRSKLAPRFDKAEWDQLTEDEVLPWLGRLDATHQNRVLFTLRMQASTTAAVSILKGGKVDGGALPFLGAGPIARIRTAPGPRRHFVAVGQIMNHQHELLRDLYDVSIPPLEHIRDGALEAGALGVKISGAGGGGALVALVSDSAQGRAIVRASKEAGAVHGWVTRAERGARVEVA
jgi:galactokinase